MITITLNHQKIAYDPKSTPRRSLLSVLRAHNIYLSAPCNGTGKCGKCVITLLKGNLPSSEADRAHFSPAELAAGKRLACRAYPESDLTIALSSTSAEEDFEILSHGSGLGAASSEFVSSEAFSSGDHRDVVETITSCDSQVSESIKYGIAVDLGTTTIAGVLVNLTNGQTVATASRLNHQRMYGADVISRIQFANEGNLALLQQSVLSDLSTLLSQLWEKVPSSFSNLSHIVIGANTTMVHLLMGYSCETLGSYPFTPVSLKMLQLSARELFGDTAPDCALTILPGISAFVGGDIVSGIYASKLAESKELSILVDLGTNGEIVLGNCDRILVTSTAAGPAFEGGNISCGTGSIPGAVSNVSILGRKPVVHLIGGPKQSPCGICGTGVVALTSALRHHRILDETGTFTAPYTDGYPFAQRADGSWLTFTQSDVREIQMAKAAICAGMETLLLRYGATSSDVTHVYVAGGFGQKLDLGKALSIGLFPKALGDKLQTIGNSCLHGAIALLLSMDLQKESAHLRSRSNLQEQSELSPCSSALSSIIKKSAEISLSTDSDFTELYLTHMKL